MKKVVRAATDLDFLQRLQDEAFGVGAPVITRIQEAEFFLAQVGVVLATGAPRVCHWRASTTFSVHG